MVDKQELQLKGLPEDHSMDQPGNIILHAERDVSKNFMLTSNNIMNYDWCLF
jgi:hypothetical protein